MLIRDWSSDVCSSDLGDRPGVDDDIVPHDARLEIAPDLAFHYQHTSRLAMLSGLEDFAHFGPADDVFEQLGTKLARHRRPDFVDQIIDDVVIFQRHAIAVRSEEHTSELQSLMSLSYALFCLK